MMPVATLLVYAKGQRRISGWRVYRSTREAYRMRKALRTYGIVTYVQKGFRPPFASWRKVMRDHGSRQARPRG
jgi:hypothetical protein